MRPNFSAPIACPEWIVFPFGNIRKAPLVQPHDDTRCLSVLHAANVVRAALADIHRSSRMADWISPGATLGNYASVR